MARSDLPYTRIRHDEGLVAVASRTSKPRWRLLVADSLRKGKMHSVLMVCVSLALALLAWNTMSNFFGAYLLPPPLRVAEEMIPMVQSGELMSNMVASLIRIGVGFAIGSAVGIVVGALMGRIRIFRELVDPVVELLRYTSPTAMIPIAVIWFGIGEASKDFLVFWGVAFIVLISTWSGVAQVPLVRERAARCLGAKEWQIFVYVVLPASVPYIVAGLRVAMASAFVSIIPAELIAAQSGLGYLLQEANLFGQTDRIFVALVTITGLGFLSDLLLRYVVGGILGRYTKWGSLS